MREIKFRYYDFNDKEMYYDVQNCYDYGHFGPNIGVESFGELLRDIASGIVKGELMQFTGLKDINGKEIYEGDIIVPIYIPPLNTDTVEQLIKSQDFDYDEIGKVVYINGSYYLDRKYSIMQNLNASIERDFDGYQVYTFKNNIVLGKVIGNIYENPELIGE